jgi:hypothetical protein
MKPVITSASDWPLAARANKRPHLLVLLFVFLSTLTTHAAPTHEIALIIGAPGEPAYAENFATAARAWQNAAERAGAALITIGLSLESEAATPDDRTRLQTWLAARTQNSDTPSPAATTTPLWIVYIGHGTHDARETRLNLRGPDVTARELAAWLAPLTRPLIFIHGGSAGAPFINALSGPDRIIISATRSGNELNYARFGERFADAVANPAADIDQDGQTSLLEAFVTAAQQVQAFYAETGRLATEHALIDDNGDKQGTPAEWFRGTRVQRRPQNSTAQPDGQHARLLALIPTEAERALTPAQREQRDVLERELEALRAQKSSLSEDDYYRQLESLFRRLGALYRSDS